VHRGWLARGVQIFGDAGRRIDSRVRELRSQNPKPGPVIEMDMRQHDPFDRLVQRADIAGRFARIGQEELAVEHDQRARPLDDDRIGEQAVLRARVNVNLVAAESKDLNGSVHWSPSRVSHPGYRRSLIVGHIDAL
jgi:hypothetical protein